MKRNGGFPAADVEHVAVKLAGLDQRGKLRLGFPDAPWRAHSLPQALGFPAVNVVEFKIYWLSHANLSINLLDLCQHV
ncbi:hypothetical protein MNVI_14800 [Mycobacterium noviomagense]|uniref:Uncharacterized protein n=1 Tax=Mycobacterium noviomagense TaxID=459858 RepID=A0A7I7PC74_9MYCO|nr:hypothetical protein MNVI_14800 [Mycobacterium noviomagense]